MTLPGGVIDRCLSPSLPRSLWCFGRQPQKVRAGHPLAQGSLCTSCGAHLLTERASLGLSPRSSTRKLLTAACRLETLP